MYVTKCKCFCVQLVVQQGGTTVVFRFSGNSDGKFVLIVVCENLKTGFGFFRGGSYPSRFKLRQLSARSQRVSVANSSIPQLLTVLFCRMHNKGQCKRNE